MSVMSAPTVGIGQHHKGLKRASSKHLSQAVQVTVLEQSLRIKEINVVILASLMEFTHARRSRIEFYQKFFFSQT